MLLLLFWKEHHLALEEWWQKITKTIGHSGLKTRWSRNQREHFFPSWKRDLKEENSLTNKDGWVIFYKFKLHAGWSDVGKCKWVRLIRQQFLEVVHRRILCIVQDRIGQKWLESLGCSLDRLQYLWTHQEGHRCRLQNDLHMGTDSGRALSVDHTSCPQFQLDRTSSFFLCEAPYNVTINRTPQREIVPVK